MVSGKVFLVYLILLLSDYSVLYFRFRLIFVCMTMCRTCKKVHLLFKVTKQISVAIATTV